MQKLLLVFLVFWGAENHQSPADAGKTPKYFKYDLRGKVKPDAYPELSLEDLRRISFYSQLTIGNMTANIADDQHMRSITKHPRDPELLIVTSDHFRFTVFKKGKLGKNSLPKRGKNLYRFLWIKHATKDSPDGHPWLNDLILLPYHPRSGKLLNRWPFRSIALSNAYPRELRPREPQDSVIGTLKAGKASYLVLDVPGAYALWGKVASHEFVSLRGKDPETIDKFHKQKRRGRSRGHHYEGVPLAGLEKWQCGVLGTDKKHVRNLKKRIPALLESNGNKTDKQMWADLLRLEVENRPIKELDEKIRGASTLGDMLRWMSDFVGSSYSTPLFHMWSRSLDSIVKQRDYERMYAWRIVRYSLRRRGFPTRIHGVHETKSAWPRSIMQVHVPDQNMSCYMDLAGRRIVFVETSESFLCSAPNFQVTRNGTIPIFDIDIGGRSAGPPIVR